MRNKPPLGTPLKSGHRQIPEGGWWLFQDGAGGTAYNIVDLTGDTDGVFTNIDIPRSANSGWNPGKFGKTPIYDGTNDEIIVPDALRLSSQHQSITFWMRAPVPVPGSKIMIGKSNDLDPGAQNTSGWNIYVQAARVCKWWVTGTAVVASTTIVDTGAWFHIACVRVGDDLTTSNGDYFIYINGVLEDETIGHVDNFPATRGYNSNYDLTFASGFFYIPVSYGNFQLDDIRIFNRPLVQPEIQDIMHDGFDPFADLLDVAMLAQLGVPNSWYYRTLMQGDRL